METFKLAKLLYRAHVINLQEGWQRDLMSFKCETEIDYYS